jgi:hypothetical protein
MEKRATDPYWAPWAADLRDSAATRRDDINMSSVTRVILELLTCFFYAMSSMQYMKHMA